MRLAAGRGPAAHDTEEGSSGGPRRQAIAPVGAGGEPSGAAGSSAEDSGPEQAGKEGPLKWQTVNVYNAAIAELYHYQVSMGLNKAPTFRGATHKPLMKGLSRTQDQRSRDTFQDRGAGGIDSGYSQEEFLQMQDKLLSGAGKAPQVRPCSFL
jgi:hypothetical protein